MSDTGAAAPPPTPATSAIPIPARHSNPSIPVVLNEAGLDSPSFRATALHFSDQVDGIERWLEGYTKTTSKLSHDIQILEATINDYLSKIVPPVNVISVDHDYTALALKRISEGSREWWTHMLNTAKKLDTQSVEPLRNFLQNDLRCFKETRRNLETSQKTFDTTLARYVSQTKTKEPSSLREDAFAVYETRKAYLKASMDFCQMAPQLRFTLDKILVRVSSEIWREMKRARDSTGSFAKWGHEMDRVKGWSKEMELTESLFKRELQSARREVGERTIQHFKPSRELDDYSANTVPFLGSKGPMHVTSQGQSATISEKQGWLFLRMMSGKPARPSWTRRWYYCRDGIFGWLVNGPQGVLQGDEIGVLLCNAKPAVAEERRFCFEVKTKNQNMLLQAETQTQLMEWLEVFEVAKKRAFEASVSRDNSALPGGVDPAFAITPPSMPEFSAKNLDAQVSLGLEDAAPTMDRQATLAVPTPDGGLAPRQSVDIGVAPRRSATSLARDLVREEGESGREHAARIMQKLDLHRKANFSSSTDTTATPAPPPSGGIASLISASHGLLPGYPSPVVGNPLQSPRLPAATPVLGGPEPQAGSLAPSTLAKPPAPTSLSKTAVVYSSDRAFSGEVGHTMPTAILANYWGSNAWARDYAPKPKRPGFQSDDPFGPDSPSIKMSTVGDNGELRTPSSNHKKATSMDAKIIHPSQAQDKLVQEQFPPGYPLELKTNAAQFRLLFPSVPLEEKLVLVFRASWNSTSDSEAKTPSMAGNGRVYVTPDTMYFYGHQMGLVVAYTISLDNITEVTAAPGRDCDFIFLHLNQDSGDNAYSRITIKTFLEDLDLLHARLNLLVDDLQAEEPMDLPDLVKALISLENEETNDKRSPSVESWEEVSANTPIDDGTVAGRAVIPRSNDFIYKSRSRGVRKHVPAFTLPTHPVHYEPEDMQKKVAERTFEISAKACFHVLFGDKSFVFPKLYFERRAKQIAQGPWTLGETGRMQRTFQFNVAYTTMLGQRRAEEISDKQTIDVFSDHVTYVVAHVKTPWHLPHATSFKLVTKIVITHIAKSKCKMAIYTKVAWSKPPALAKNMVERHALDDAGRDAEELADVATEQVHRLGSHSRTKRAIEVYGSVGQQAQVVLFTPGDTDSAKKPQINPRTLTSMLFDTVRSFGESAASSVLMWVFACIKTLWDVITSQRLLLSLLAFSVFTNLVFSGQSTSAWWTERKAAGFMNRIGVGPNVMMSKAIYLADLDEAARSSAIQPSWPQDSYCYSTFQSIANSTDIDGPYENSGSSLSSGASRATARRLRRTRQRLGSYRHDLLVAMRMVNSVEREMIQSEWENWLMDENTRCEQVKAVLQAWDSSSNGASGNDNSGGSGINKVSDEATQKVMKTGEKDKRKREGLRLWHEEYCGSCQVDHERLIEERRGMSLGL